MRNNLDALDSKLAAEMNMYIDDSAVEDSTEDVNMFHVTLGSVQRPQTLLKIEELHSDEPSFQRFHTKLNAFFSAYDIAQADGQKIKLMSNDTVSLRFVTVFLNGPGHSTGSISDYRTSLFESAFRVESQLVSTHGLPAMQPILPQCYSAGLCHHSIS